MKPTSLSSLEYYNAPQVYQAVIRNSKQALDRPPETHKDWATWNPSKSLAGDYMTK